MDHVQSVKDKFKNNEGDDLHVSPEEMEALLVYCERLEMMVEAATNHTIRKDKAIQLGIKEKVQLNVSRVWLWEQATGEKITLERFNDKWNLKIKKGNIYVLSDPKNFQMKKVVKKKIVVDAVQIPFPFLVNTLEGMFKGKKDDYLICGIKGELYCCDKKIFEETYEEGKEENDLENIN